MIGDAAWSLIAQLKRDEVDQYLANRRALGFNTVLVSLIEHKFATDAPANIYGDAPFTTPGDFSTPNESYFAHVDWVLGRLRDEGFLVLLTPDYLGYGDFGEGWKDELADNSTTTLFEYGRYLGSRYKSFDNVMWVAGGDDLPGDPSGIDAVARGIAKTDPDALHTAHLRSNVPPREYWGDSSWLDVDNVYTYDPVYRAAADAYEQSSLPFFLLESAYEHEHGVSVRQLRTQAIHALFTGATGHVFGNNPIWHFGSGGLYPAPVTWQEALDGDGSRSMAAITAFMSGIEWWELRPDIDGEFLTGGLGKGQDRAVAAVAVDGSWAVVYVPTYRTMTIDLGRLDTAATRLTWFDPTSGEAVWTETNTSMGVVDVETPGQNATSDEDWILVLSAP